MQIIKELIKIPDLSLALGFFDGVHTAHQKLINEAVEFAKQNNVKSAVVTLKQQPYCFLNNIKPKYISSREKSYEIIKRLGTNYLIELDFNDISKMTSSEYLSNILVKYFSPVGIFTGFNHHFGLNREGNCEFLANYQQKFGYKFSSLTPQELNGNLISSSAIRNNIVNGKIEDANLMLGREFSVNGIVVEGNKIGRTINFPTANINYPDNIVEPPYGVYFVKVELQDGRIMRGIANFGIKPTVSSGNAKTLEAHILDGFSENIYSQNIEVYFLKFIRPEQKFDNLETLKNQIQKDISLVVFPG